MTRGPMLPPGDAWSPCPRCFVLRPTALHAQMCATLVCNTKNENEQSIICVNYVLSGSQYSHVVMDKEQVDQPMVRIKHDEDAVSPDTGHTGSPDSCRGNYYLSGSLVTSNLSF